LERLHQPGTLKEETVVPDASYEQVENGVRAAGQGWFIVNARHVPSFESELDVYAVLEPENVSIALRSSSPAPD
jgi:hypothetical protein